MIKNTILLIFIFCSILTTKSQCIDYVYIPDANFKASLISNTEINTDGDAEISCEEANAFSGIIDVSGSNIEDLAGIEYFVNITRLNCSNNNLTSLNIPINLGINDDGFSLSRLDCSNNNLTSLDLSNSYVSDLNCSNNNLTSLKIPTFEYFSSLDCSNNNLTSLPFNSSLIYLNCSNNNLTSLAVSYSLLTSLDCSNNNLTSLDMFSTYGLGSLDCSNNNLTSLDVVSPYLTTLNCSNNAITSLSIGPLVLEVPNRLSSLDCSNNDLTSLDVSGYVSLTSFKASGNENLQKLNLANGNNINMSVYDIDSNSEMLLDVRDNPSLSCVQVDSEGYHSSWPDAFDEGISFSGDCYTNCIVEIPDANFKAVLVSNTEINTDGNTEISCEEANAFDGIIDVADNNIEDLTGIEHFVNITRLNCSNNSLSSLDLSNNLLIVDLNCSNNNLTSLRNPNGEYFNFLDCSNNNLTSLIIITELYYVNCSNNNLTSLQLSSASLISFLDCSNNDITYLNMPFTYDLSYLDCSNNNLTNLAVVSPHLTSLNCSNNAITSLSIEPLVLEVPNRLSSLDCSNNSFISLDVSGHVSLTSFKASGNENLQKLNLANGNNINMSVYDIDSNSEMLLDVRDNPNLSCVQVDDVTYSDSNWIEAFDEGAAFSENCFSNCNVTIFDANFKAALVANTEINTDGNTEISCEEANAFTGTINVNDSNIRDLTGIEYFVNITRLYCSNNYLTSLDVSNNEHLISLYCYSNSLTSLDVSNNLLLENFGCSNNYLTSLDISNNGQLLRFWASDNNLQSLNMANGNNNSMDVFFDVFDDSSRMLDFRNNSNLSCVQVDLGYVGWPGAFDEGVIFSENCNFTNCVVAIPDANFKAALVANAEINTDGDTEISCDEASAFSGSINVSASNIEDLTGIEYFVFITELLCSSNQLSSLDISSNPYLNYLDCSSNQLSSLVSLKEVLHSGSIHPNKLEYLNCSSNQLSSLDISNNPYLNYLNCSSNQLSSLDIYNNIEINYLDCSVNELTILDVYENTQIEYLNCSNNSLTRLNITNNVQLTEFLASDNNLYSLNMANGNNKNMPVYDMNTTERFIDVHNNSDLSCVEVDSEGYHTSWLEGFDEGVTFSENCSDCVIVIPDDNFKAYLIESIEINTDRDSEISCEEANAFVGSINVSANNIEDLSGIEYFVNIISLDCSGNSLTSLDVSNNSNLVSLDCSGNSLTSLDVSNNSNLVSLDCGGNSLTSLDVSNNSNLEILNCSYTSLTSLDVSNNPNLEILNCNRSNLVSLDISKNIVLKDLFCFQNNLISLDLSNGVELEFLDCSSNSLTSLDVSDNFNLEFLNCSSNSLTSLNISDNSNLVSLSCSNNSLISLDISDNPKLLSLNARSNNLQSLNMANGNNLNMSIYESSEDSIFQETRIDVLNNPDLSCIQVDAAGYHSSWSWPAFDFGVTFSENCDVTLTVNYNEYSESISIYPNPVLDNLNISLSTSNEIVEVKIYSLQGEEVLTTTNMSVNMNLLSTGMYVVKIFGKDGEVGIKTILKK